MGYSTTSDGRLWTERGIMAKEDFPRLLREWRKANRLSQAALAKCLGINRATITQYETGKRKPCFEIGKKLTSVTNLKAGTIPQGRHFTKLESRQFTEKERYFAVEHYGCVIDYLRSHELDHDEWYEICVFAYPKAVQLWFIRRDQHKHSFSTIAYKRMDFAVKDEYQARKHRPRTVSLDDIIPGTEDMTYGETLCDPRDCVRT